MDEWFDREFLTISDRGHIDRRKTELVNYWAYTALFFINSEDVIKLLKSLNWEFSTLRGKERTYARNGLFFNTLVDVCERAILSKHENFEFILNYLENNYKKRESVPFWWVDLILSVISKSSELNKQDYCQRLIKELPIEELDDKFFDYVLCWAKDVLKTFLLWWLHKLKIYRLAKRIQYGEKWGNKY